MLERFYLLYLGLGSVKTQILFDLVLLGVVLSLALSVSP